MKWQCKLNRWMKNKYNSERWVNYSLSQFLHLKKSFDPHLSSIMTREKVNNKNLFSVKDFQVKIHLENKYDERQEWLGLEIYISYSIWSEAEIFIVIMNSIFHSNFQGETLAHYSNNFRLSSEWKVFNLLKPSWKMRIWIKTYIEIALISRQKISYKEGLALINYSMLKIS